MLASPLSGGSSGQTAVSGDSGPCAHARSLVDSPGATLLELIRRMCSVLRIARADDFT